jgi:hypothetical protein
MGKGDDGASSSCLKKAAREFSARARANIARQISSAPARIEALKPKEAPNGASLLL